MAPNRFMTELDFTKTQLAVYYVVFLLSVDTLNPVKVLCHVIPGLQQWHLAGLSLLLMIYVFFAQFKQLLYFAVKIFFHSILSIFFREVQVIGSSNIPTTGPVIFTINHANQFVDAVMVLSTCKRNVSYLMAEASYNRPVIGHIAYALGKCYDVRKQKYGCLDWKILTATETLVPHFIFSSNRQVWYL